MKRAATASVNPSLRGAGDPIDVSQFLGAETGLAHGCDILA